MAGRSGQSHENPYITFKILQVLAKDFSTNLPPFYGSRGDPFLNSLGEKEMLVRLPCALFCLFVWRPLITRCSVRGFAVSSDPIGEFDSDAGETLLAESADGAVQDVGCNHREAGDSNHARSLEASFTEVWIGLPQNLINSRYFLSELGRDHAQEPVIVWPRQMAHHQGWPNLAGNLTGLRKRE